MPPASWFDSVAENLLQNAIAKAQEHAGIRIDVAFDAASGGRLTIRDSGEAILKVVATRLFSVPVPSRNGLGIGLYLRRAAGGAGRLRARNRK